MTDEPRQPGDMTGEPGDVTGEPGGAPGGASTGRELTPRPAEPTPAVTPREPVVPTPTTAPADRFYAGDQAHTVGLTEQRAAQIVRQSGNARMVAFLATLLIVLFIPIYWLADIGIPAVGIEGQMAGRENAQYVTDVSRGYALYLANCARCHGNNGQGGLGPSLNDQMKLHNALTPEGLAGTGHLNPDYLHTVMRDGGRYVCGNPNSEMPAWEQPRGPLNYREVEEIIAFMLASTELTFIYDPHHVEPGHEVAEEPRRVQGWRDPNFTPPPDATPVPACWTRPEGPDTGATPAPPVPVESPGTEENPRIIAVEGTGSLQWVDPETGTQLTSIGVVQGETVQFQVINRSPVEHNFHIGSAEQLETAPAEVDLPGVSPFVAGEEPEDMKVFTYTFDELPENPQFACTVPGHYPTMHGDFVLVEPGAGENGENGGENGGEGGEASPAASPAGSPAPSPAASP